MNSLNIKEELLERLIAITSAELETLQSIAQTSRSETINKDIKQESKYDTRSIEAGYLAGAQKKRVKELERDYNLLVNFDRVIIKEEHRTIQVASLFELTEIESDSGQEKAQKVWFFISPSIGGQKIQVQGCDYSIISTHSPISDQGIGLGVDEFIEVELPSETKEYRISSIT